MASNVHYVALLSFYTYFAPDRHQISLTRRKCEVIYKVFSVMFRTFDKLYRITNKIQLAPHDLSAQHRKTISISDTSLLYNPE